MDYFALKWLILDILSLASLLISFKVAYNSGMFDNSHLLIMLYFFGTICENFLKDLLIQKRKWLNLSDLALQILKLFGI